MNDQSKLEAHIAKIEDPFASTENKVRLQIQATEEYIQRISELESFACAEKHEIEMERIRIMGEDIDKQLSKDAAADALAHKVIRVVTVGGIVLIALYCVERLLSGKIF